MKSYIKIVCILVFALLNGCAVNSYVEPQNQSIATIRPFVSESSIVNYDIARIIQIDGKNTFYSDDKAIPVSAGNHTFTIETSVVHGVFDGLSKAYSEINATLLPGHHYQLNELTEKGHIKVWIVDQNGKIISPMVTDPYRSQQDQIIYMPMTSKSR